MDLTLKLLKPIKLDGEIIESLTLRELTVDENIALEQGAGTRGFIEQDKYYFAMSCGVPPAAIGSLGERDWKRLKTKYTQTLGNVEPEPTSAES